MSYRRRGLGYNLYDLEAASGMENCDPRDSACVARNAQRDNAAVDQWMTVMKDPNTANLPTPQFQVNLDNSAAALNSYMNNQPVTSVTSELGAGPVVSIAQLERAYTAPVAVVPKPKPPVSTTPAGQVIVNSGGVPAAGEGSAALPSSFSVAGVSLPWWGWLGIAGAGLYVFGGKRNG